MFQELAVLKNWAHSVQGQKTNKSRFWDLFYEAPVSFRLGKRRCTSMLSQIAMTWEFNRPQIRYLSKTLSAPIRIGVPLFLVHFLHLVNRGVAQCASYQSSQKKQASNSNTIMWSGGITLRTTNDLRSVLYRLTKSWLLSPFFLHSHSNIGHISPLLWYKILRLFTNH